MQYVGSRKVTACLLFYAEAHLYSKLEQIFAISLPNTAEFRSVFTPAPHDNTAARQPPSAAMPTAPPRAVQFKFILGLVREYVTWKPTTIIDQKLQELGTTYYSQMGKLEAIDINYICFSVGCVQVIDKANKKAVINHLEVWRQVKE